MLNRKFSNYLFYFILVAIVGIIFLIRGFAIGSIDNKISDLEINNLLVQAQISSIEEIVEDNNDKQIDHLYELYTQVPNILSTTELRYFTMAQLELVGITEEPIMDRRVDINPNVTFPPETVFALLQKDFNIVEVQVEFNTSTSDVIAAFIDLIYTSDQIFIINNVSFINPDDVNSLKISIDFLAFYVKEDAS